MRAIRRENTAPEQLVRKTLHREGFRYRLHDDSLPGTPDLVLPKYRSVIFVHGCFWHAHTCRHGSVRARKNAAWWCAKLAENRNRDRRKKRQLRALGWQVIEVWECQVKREQWLERVYARLIANRK